MEIGHQPAAVPPKFDKVLFTLTFPDSTEETGTDSYPRAGVECTAAGQAGAGDPRDITPNPVDRPSVQPKNLTVSWKPSGLGRLQCGRRDARSVHSPRPCWQSLSNQL